MNFYKSKICIIGGHKTTEILINNIKKIYTDKLDIYYYKPKRIKKLVLYSDLKKNLKTNDNFFQFTKLSKIENKIIHNKYDYLFAIGLSQILSINVIKSIKQKILGFHPSFLPNGKGRSSSAWNIRLEKNGGCSFFIINNENVDSGKIIYKKKILINKSDNAETYTKKYLSVFDSMTKKILMKPEYFFNKKIIYPKSRANSYYHKLKPSNSFIDWSDKTSRIKRIIKSSTHPHHGSFGFIGDRLFEIFNTVERKKSKNFVHYAEPGTILEKIDFEYLVKTGDGTISVEIYENLKIGERFTVINPYLIFKILSKLKINI